MANKTPVTLDTALGRRECFLGHLEKMEAEMVPRKRRRRPGYTFVQVAEQMEIALVSEFLIYATCRPQTLVDLSLNKQLKFAVEGGPAASGERKLVFEAFVDKNWRRKGATRAAQDALALPPSFADLLGKFTFQGFRDALLGKRRIPKEVADGINEQGVAVRRVVVSGAQDKVKKSHLLTARYLKSFFGSDLSRTDLRGLPG